MGGPRKSKASAGSLTGAADAMRCGCVAKVRFGFFRFSYKFHHIIC